MEIRQHERLEGELGFLLDVFERVLREAAQLDADRSARASSMRAR